MGNHCARVGYEEGTKSTSLSTAEPPKQEGTSGSNQSEKSVTLEQLRQQRIRLSLDVEGEQLPSLRELKSTKIPPYYGKHLKELKTVPDETLLPVDARKSRKVGGTSSYGDTENQVSERVNETSGTVEDSSINTNTTVRATECSLPIRYGACSLAGWEPVRELRSKEQRRKENQDSFYIEIPFDGREDEAFFAVFDGHGVNGRIVAEFIRDQLPFHIKDSLRLLQDNVQPPSCQEGSYENNVFFTTTDENISCAYYELKHSVSFFNLVRSIYAGFNNCKRALVALNGEVDISMSGTTAVAVWFKCSFLFCCNVGDSRCIIGRQTLSRKHKYIAVDITCDHKPSRTDEADRIQRSGGRIEYWESGVGPLRVWLPESWLPGLAMTRSFGDTVVERIGVISEPEVTCIKLTHFDRFCILASDGIWEFMSSGEVVNWIGRVRDKCSAQLAAEMIVEEAVRRWRKEDEVVDDTTTIVLWLDYVEGRTDPTVTESGISNSRQFTEERSSMQDNNSRLPYSMKYLWKLFSDSRKDDIYSTGYAPIAVTDKFILKPFTSQIANC